MISLIRGIQKRAVIALGLLEVVESELGQKRVRQNQRGSCFADYSQGRDHAIICSLHHRFGGLFGFYIYGVERLI